MGVIIAIVTLVCSMIVIILPNVPESLKTSLGIVIIIAAIVCHIMAISKVKSGKLTVYRNWKDFGFSCSWPIAAIASGMTFLGGALSDSGGGKIAWMVVGTILAVVAFVSIVWMFYGAFTNNRSRLGASFIALSARLTATLFFLTYLGKFLEVKDGLEDSNVGIGDYIKSVIGFIIFTMWFKWLVVPLVKDNRENTSEME